MSDTFPRQYARTQRLTLGDPRTITVAADGQRVLFARSWRRRRPGELLVGARHRHGRGAAGRRPPAPAGCCRRRAPSDRGAAATRTNARRRRRRHHPTPDAASTVAAFDASAGTCSWQGCCRARRELVVDGPVFDPAPTRPVATCVAYVCGRTAAHRRARWQQLGALGDEHPDISEALRLYRRRRDGRHRVTGGAPTRRNSTRADIGPVQRWYISDPANPDQQANEVATLPPAPPTPTSRCTCWRSMRQYRSGLGRHLPVPRRRAVGRFPAGCCYSSVAISAR